MRGPDNGAQRVVRNGCQSITGSQEQRLRHKLAPHLGVRRFEAGTLSAVGGAQEIARLSQSVKGRPGWRVIGVEIGRGQGAGAEQTGIASVRQLK